MTADRPRAVIVGVQLPDLTDEEHHASLDELARLADTMGLRVIGRVSQRRSGLAKAAVLGRGKLAELACYTGGTGEVPSPAPVKKQKRVYLSGTQAPPEEEEEPPPAEDDDDAGEGLLRALPAEEQATWVLVDHEITPSQARNLERAAGAEVLDRTAVILEIFRRHARSREARLEVEIARLCYLAPRLRESGGGGDRQRGGIGGRGAGESALELDRRKVRDRIAELRRELEGIAVTAKTQRSRRAGQSTAALVGYTNAGKSSLMRALTGTEVYVADALFATLGTTVRALYPEVRPRILVSDTVGFIKKLPHDLVASFRATLDAALEAHLLLHVVDASDAAYLAQHEVTRQILDELGVTAPRLLVLNKIDRVTPERREALEAAHPGAFLMSAKAPDDVAALRAKIVAFFDAQMAEAELFVPYARQALVSQVHESCRVISEAFEEEGTRLQVRGDAAALERLRVELG